MFETLITATDDGSDCYEPKSGKIKRNKNEIEMRKMPREKKRLNIPNENSSMINSFWNVFVL